MKKILIIGKNGQVGSDLLPFFASLGEVKAWGREEVDLSQPEKLIAPIRAYKPNLIINAAAYTAVDQAEKESEKAFTINAQVPKILAEEAKKLAARLIHYSTDYVFDGLSTRPYDEKDPTAPRNVYGHSKLAGEKAIQEVGGDFLILRTSWVYTSRGKNFLLTMLRLAKEKDTLKIVCDQQGAPTWSQFIAQATAKMAFLPGESGIYHLTCAGKTNWAEFAERIFEEYRSLTINFKVPKVISISTSEYPTPAMRPLYSVLSNKKINAAFHVSMPEWQEGLKLCLKGLV